jgi:hypothetical protein
MKFQLGAMTVGDILDRGLKLLFARLPTFYAISLIVYIPTLVVQLLHPALGLGDFALASGQGVGAQMLGPLLVSIVNLIMTMVGTGAVLHVISQEFIGQRAGLGEAFRVGLARFGALLGTSLLTGLIIGLGLVMCLVPGIIFAIWYAFIAQVVVMEGLAGPAAMNRSKALGEGYRGRIFGVFVLLNLIVGVAQVVIMLLLMQVFPYFEIVSTGGGKVTVKTDTTNYIIDVLILALVLPLFTSFLQICSTLLYFDLRIRKEGFDLEVAAQQMSGREGAGDLFGGEQPPTPDKPGDLSGGEQPPASW